MLMVWPSQHALMHRLHARQCLLSNLHTVLQCRNLGEVYGLPKMHYKGKQGDFYIMVCSARPALLIRRTLSGLLLQT